MLTWLQFQDVEAEMSQAAVALLNQNEVAFLATVSKRGRPRIHPFVPKIVDGHLVAFIMDNSPKLGDLKVRKKYGIHTLPGKEDEQFYLSGEATNCDNNTQLREAAEIAMGFATGVDEHHILHEFRLERALWTTWLDFGTPDHRAFHKRWLYQTGT
ncbi:MAG: pyridoxamine 5'-phosphate oxidase family protein [Kordiimonadaceae bacterium]|nr:pyridoxamine 5'-phosphate oxidase family protein [Kordiimonadaceae bacterium]